MAGKKKVQALSTAKPAPKVFPQEAEAFVQQAAGAAPAAEPAAEPADRAPRVAPAAQEPQVLPWETPEAKFRQDVKRNFNVTCGSPTCCGSSGSRNKPRTACTTSSSASSSRRSTPWSRSSSRNGRGGRKRARFDAYR